jgi:hypothetical protein
MAVSFSSARDGVIRPLSTDVSIFDSITPNLKISSSKKKPTPENCQDAGELPIQADGAHEGCAGDLVVVEIVDLHDAGAASVIGCLWPTSTP